jgi:FKBP-type peptidyl-prolyl cis-trans isomerase FkpA
MNNRNNLYYLLFIIPFLFSCTNNPRELRRNETDKKAEDLIKINKFLVGKDADIIKGYIERRNWQMQISQSGLRYMIYEHGKGAKVQTGNKVTIWYSISLMDGTLCYSSDKDGLKSFVVGKGGVEPGLEEGVLLMHQGDKARFILMPHLAYGLVGDGKSIPARSTILYELQLIQITP